MAEQITFQRGTPITKEWLNYVTETLEELKNGGAGLNFDPETSTLTIGTRKFFLIEVDETPAASTPETTPATPAE